MRRVRRTDQNEGVVERTDGWVRRGSADGKVMGMTPATGRVSNFFPESVLNLESIRTQDSGSQTRDGGKN